MVFYFELKSGVPLWIYISLLNHPLLSKIGCISNYNKCKHLGRYISLSQIIVEYFIAFDFPGKAGPYQHFLIQLVV